MSKGPVDAISLSLTEKLFISNENNASAESVDIKKLELKKAKVYYSINLILSEFSKILLMGVLALILGLFLKYLFCLGILLLTRSILGGLHGNGYLQCLIISILCNRSVIRV